MVKVGDKVRLLDDGGYDCCKPGMIVTVNKTCAGGTIDAIGDYKYPSGASWKATLAFMENEYEEIEEAPEKGSTIKLEKGEYYEDKAEDGMSIAYNYVAYSLAFDDAEKKQDDAEKELHRYFDSAEYPIGVKIGDKHYIITSDDIGFVKEVTYPK
jgi:hypothetical protein